MPHKPVTIGVIGTGAISGAYLGMAQNFPNVRIAACADLDPARARAAADKFGVPKVHSVDDLLKDDSIEIILNLTIPAAHVPIALEALERGKHTFCEKPLAIDRAEGERLFVEARQRGSRVGSAPDTFLGSGIQTARKLIDDGIIGRPLAFTAFMMGRGHEHWHPSPEFYYQPGGGPMFDMGPYYLTALLNLLGPIKRVTGFTTISRSERPILSEPKKGQMMTVTTPDHYVGSIEFANGCCGAIVQSFAMRSAQYDGKTPIHIFGDRGAIRVPDPNTFDGPVFINVFDQDQDYAFREVPPAFPTGYGRSVGLADMAAAIRKNRPHRCSLEQAFTVLDAMQGFLDASDSGKAYELASGYERPAPMPPGSTFGVLD